MNPLSCSKFTHGYAGLNKLTRIAATHLDITRAMLSVGYPSARGAASVGGPWRAILLQNMTKGYLDNSLRTTRYFRDLEPSEKATVSFLLAQAFTSWFAQTHMGMFYVVHVHGAGHSYKPSLTPAHLKAGVAFRPRSRPDFIGVEIGGHHVFESKGRSSSLSARLLNTALDQASMIKTVNGSAPVTHVAACFSFQKKGATGRIVDPPAANGFDLRFDEARAALKAYTFFLEPEFREAARWREGGLIGVRLADDLVYGIDEAVLAALEELRERRRQERDLSALLSLLASRQSLYEDQDPDISIGCDGTFLRR